NRLYFNTFGPGQLRSVASYGAYSYAGSRIESGILMGLSEITSLGFSDGLFDFTKAAPTTGNIAITTATPWLFEGDTHRAVRTDTNGVRSLQWHQPGLKGFGSVFYSK